MKKITSNTLLKQGGKTYKPVEMTNGNIYWITSEIPKIGQLGYSNVSKSIVRFTDPRFFSDGTIFSIIVQSEPKLDGVPVISLDSYVERLAYKISRQEVPILSNGTLCNARCNLQEGILQGVKLSYQSNPNQYTLADIEKVYELSRENKNYSSVFFTFTKKEIIDQINQIQSITVDEQFNILSYV